MNGKRQMAVGCVLVGILVVGGGLFEPAAAQTKPEGEMRWALYVTLAPVWFDPGQRFSFYRTKGAKILKEKVREVEIVDRYRVRFHLHEPFPDFMAFYGTPATGAGWIVSKKHVEKVGDDGFKKQPIGLGPYKFVSHTPGIELVMEANEGFEYIWPSGIGPRVEEPALMLIDPYPWSAPLEEVRLKKR